MIEPQQQIIKLNKKILFGTKDGEVQGEILIKDSLVEYVKFYIDSNFDDGTRKDSKKFILEQTHSYRKIKYEENYERTEETNEKFTEHVNFEINKEEDYKYSALKIWEEEHLSLETLDCSNENSKECKRKKKLINKIQNNSLSSLEIYRLVKRLLMDLLKYDTSIPYKVTFLVEWYIGKISYGKIEDI